MLFEVVSEQKHNYFHFKFSKKQVQRIRRKFIQYKQIGGSQCRVAGVGVASVALMGSQCRVASVGVASVEGSRCRFRWDITSCEKL
jgi:hypothetical protein